MFLRQFTAPVKRNTLYMYIDHCLLIASPEGLQQLMSVFHEDAENLKIRSKKTNVLSLGSHDHETLAIKFSKDELKQVDRFCYLGSMITSNCDLDAEVNSRKGAAAAAFSKLLLQRCSAHMILNWLPRSRYMPKQGLIRMLDRLHLSCVRNILDIRWSDRAPLKSSSALSSISTGTS